MKNIPDKWKGVLCVCVCVCVVCVCVCVCVCNDIGLERTIPISGSLKHYLEDKGGVQWIWKQRKSEIVLLILGQETWIFKILDSSLLRDVWLPKWH